MISSGISVSDADSKLYQLTGIWEKLEKCVSCLITNHSFIYSYNHLRNLKYTQLGISKLS